MYTYATLLICKKLLIWKKNKNTWCILPRQHECPENVPFRPPMTKGQEALKATEERLTKPKETNLSPIFPYVEILEEMRARQDGLKSQYMWMEPVGNRFPLG